VKDPLEQVDVPQIRPVYWIVMFIAILAVAALLFPGATAIVAVLLALPFIIFLHELAHFVTAKRAGMQVTEFFVGFGPRIWSVQKGETEYGLKAIPLGGYCKIIGMTNLEDVPLADEPRTYRQQPYRWKLLVASAGSLMHFALAGILMFGVLVFSGNHLDARLTTTLDQVVAGGPADRAGLEPGDEIVAIDGAPIASWDDVRPELRGHVDDSVEFMVERDGETLTIPVTLGTHPQADEFPDELEGVGFAGISPSVLVPSVSVPRAVVESPRQVWDVGVASVGALVDRFSLSGMRDYVDQVTDDGEDTEGTTGSSGGSSDSDRFISIIGFGRVAVQATEAGWVEVALLLVTLNVFVGVFNLVPLLPFDGGHIAIATYEKIGTMVRRRPVRVDVAKLLPLTAVVMAVLAFIFLSSIFLDITRPLDNPF
jgi:membrane-associated protease RseP (regulator of RpoE activity)